MRLLEPLNGIKTAQGHFVTHFIMMISMLCLDSDININLYVGDMQPANLTVVDEYRILRLLQAQSEVQNEEGEEGGEGEGGEEEEEEECDGLEEDCGTSAI